VRSIPLILGCIALALWGSTTQAAPEAPLPVHLISPWIDHHDRIESILGRLDPAVTVSRIDLERDGGRGSLEWWPAFGFPSEVSLAGPLLILENAPFLGLSRLMTESGEALASALPRWVAAGGHLLIVGGSPSIESYAGTELAKLMGFEPSENVKAFARRKRHAVAGPSGSLGRSRTGTFVEHLHGGRISGARVLLRAGGAPFLIEHRVGRGRVVTLLSGAQGALRADGGEPREEFFESRLWAEELAKIVSSAHSERFALGPMPAPESDIALASPDAFDIRYFMLTHRPYPYTLSPGEAYVHARRLRSLGFTSTVFGASSTRPLDDRRALEEIASAGLRIVYYDGVRPKSPASRFWKSGPKPARARSLSGKDAGWDVHSPEFTSAADRLLDGRPPISDLPLRAVQLVEEFKDEGADGPSLVAAQRGRGMRAAPKPGDAKWAEAETLRAAATRETFQAFRTAGQRLFPGLPQSTYWPGSYWSRPLAYGYRLSALGDAVDEVIGPGYGYGSPRRASGPESVRWSANSGWAALRDSDSMQPHLAVYAMGRPLKRNKGRTPGLLAWRETAWTGLAHGATGLAYWATPESDAISGLGRLHEEATRLGPWLSAPERGPARVALIQSWSSRGESGDPKTARGLAQCLKDSHEALEVGFEDVDLVLEERLAQLSSETQALVLVGSPALSAEAANALVSFLDRGGHLFRDSGSALRIQPGNQRLRLESRTSRPGGIHDVPINLRCSLARISHQRAGKAWRALFRAAGIAPRFETPSLETEAGLRGNTELVHVYALNHKDEATSIEVNLERTYSGREWVELRSGDPVPFVPLAPEARVRQAKLRSESVAPGEAVIWASVKRPLERVVVVPEQVGQRVRFRISGLDGQGLAVADGYPLRFDFRSGSSCAGAQARSATLISGEVELEWNACPLAESAMIYWVMTDPMTGRRWQAGENSRATVMP
jgi:hypothetical protein